MIFKLFSRLFLYQKQALIVAFLLVFGFAFYAPNLQIDASSESLMLNDDKDLNFAREITKRFSTSDFLVLTYTPKSELFSHESLKNLQIITKKLESLPLTKNTISILNAPLLQSPPLSIEQFSSNLPTLLSESVDKNLAKQEFLNSPLYKNNIVSKDFKTTAVMINLKSDERFLTLLKRRSEIANDKEHKNEFKNINEDLKIYREKLRIAEHENIKSIRQIIKEHENDAKLFLGGVSMISDDMISYVKSDVVLYGSLLLSLLIITLGFIFKQLRWVFVPILICVYSLVLTTGILGFFNFEITVISSNFISLQLIITLSIAIHLIVQFEEYNARFKKASLKRLTFITILSKLKPSFFAIITTIVGFGSLMFSNIKPIISLGFMMSIGIFISLLSAFTLFVLITPLFKKKIHKTQKINFSVALLCKNLALNHGRKILISAFLMLFVGIYGSTKLQVENSFISYFKPTTAIFQGMKIIDEKLGGTTPLDIIVTFHDKTDEKLSDELDEFENEFKEEFKDEKYWFSREKLEIIKTVGNHLKKQKEIGSVQGLDNLLQIGKELNDNKELDSFALALIYEQIPKEHKDLILTPYVNIEKNQIRFATRIIDSNPNLRRDEFLKRLSNELNLLVGKDKAEVRLASFMVLYNNMLQSLYNSQIVTLGFVVAVLIGMFFVLFRSFKIALIAIISNLIPMSLVFGLMGLFKMPLDMMSITIAAISIGIGVDDTIHYIHRFKHEFLHFKNYKTALIKSHESTGYAMFYTSWTIILGFLILVVSNFKPTIYFGLLTVCVMALVLLGALLLLPKLLLLFKPFGKETF